MKIAIFDSGIGGLSVLYQAMKQLPDEEYYYYADTDHVPYGEKTKEEILEYSEQAVQFLIRQRADAIVIACNTATSAAAAALRAKYTLPIIGMEPAVKKALDIDPVHRVLVAATPITIQGEKLKVLMQRYDNHHLVDLLPLPGLVRFAEQGVFEGEHVQQYVSEQLQRFDLTQYSSLVLGCTHFNLFKKEIRRLLPNHMHFTDGNAGTVNQLIRQLKTIKTPPAAKPALHFFQSGKAVESPEELRKIDDILKHLAQMYLIA